MKDINRLKVVLVEQKKTSKWLAGELDKDAATIAKWCANTSQPDLKTLTQMAQLQQVDISELLNKTENVL